MSTFNNSDFSNFGFDQINFANVFGYFLHASLKHILSCTRIANVRVYTMCKWKKKYLHVTIKVCELAGQCPKSKNLSDIGRSL